jgi:hypothetical protein
MSFPLAIIQFQFGFLETVIWTNIGGIAGIYFFAFLSEKLIAWWNKAFRKKPRRKRAENRKIFTKRNRRIIAIKQRYGLFGIAATTPFLLSIPVGTFLMVRYYPSVKSKFLLLISANLIWSVLYAVFYILGKNVIQESFNMRTGQLF